MSPHVRRLFIVSRDSPDLASHLSAWFQAEIAVIVDRRHGERRGARAYAGPDRRRGGRRARPAIDKEVRLTSYALVMLPA
jgi:hypothetical protein